MFPGRIRVELLEAAGGRGELEGSIWKGQLWFTCTGWGGGGGASVAPFSDFSRAAENWVL